MSLQPDDDVITSAHDKLLFVDAGCRRSVGSIAGCRYLIMQMSDVSLIRQDGLIHNQVEAQVSRVDSVLLG